jgi:hypothetical protein
LIHVEPHAANARPEVLELGDFDLNLRAPGARVAQEHVEDDRFPVANGDARGILQVAHLRGGELRIQHQHRRPRSARAIGHRTRAARTQQRARVRVGQAMDLLTHDAPALVPHQ